MATRSKQQKKRSIVSKTKAEAVTPAMALAELRKRADQGDPEAQAALKRWLDRNPAMWQRIGDLAHHAQAEFVRLVAKGDFLFSESIRRRADEMRRELLGAFPTPLEVLAVERIVAARLYLEHVEAQCAKAEGDIPVAKFWLLRQQQAHRVYHGSVKSLLLIRELLPPEGPPAALTANGNVTAKLNGNRLALTANGNGTPKNGKRRDVATA